MELPNMKLDPKNEEFTYGKPTLSAENRDDYPAGLTIYLNDEQIDKLGFKGLPRIGDVLNMKAFVKVKSLNENSSDGEGKSRSISLQIINMLLKEQKEDQESDEVFYGDPPKPRVI